MTLIYLIVLGLLAWQHHSHWGALHPWTGWFVILVIAAVADLAIHRSVLG